MDLGEVLRASSVIASYLLASLMPLIYSRMRRRSGARLPDRHCGLPLALCGERERER